MSTGSGDDDIDRKIEQIERLKRLSCGLYSTEQAAEFLRSMEEHEESSGGHPSNGDDDEASSLQVRRPYELLAGAPPEVSLPYSSPLLSRPGAYARRADHTPEEWDAHVKRQRQEGIARQTEKRRAERKRKKAEAEEEEEEEEEAEATAASYQSPQKKRRKLTHDGKGAAFFSPKVIDSVAAYMQSNAAGFNKFTDILAEYQQQTKQQEQQQQTPKPKVMKDEIGSALFSPEVLGSVAACMQSNAAGMQSVASWGNKLTDMMVEHQKQTPKPKSESDYESDSE